ncbi:hypothetical protein [uncultured Erythrobacter sp.]|uniref:hypothetical protein n=1 Tax=uncultured Erythrobacter sp. TaxID=263913 RepID=UPI002606C118|nr:hypothetical protein [uncultured Erythrobacter sp.]
MLLSSSLLRYPPAMRFVFTLFAAMAILVSGIHAGPSQAHENDPAHASEYHAQSDDDDGGSEAPTKGDQHGCHHHCPSTAASNPGKLASADHFASARLVPSKSFPLSSTTRAPPLTPPKA